MACRSKSHEHYRQALEGLYIQTWMAHRDLANLVEELNGEPSPTGHADALSKGQQLHLREHKLDEVVERITFGKNQLAEATREVNRHFDRGCSNVPELSRVG